jgi:mersacidin/lichenicidin family type 2 lantibiotic
MNINDLINVWRDPEARGANGDLLPVSPAGLMEVSDDFLAALSGGGGNDTEKSERSEEESKIDIKISMDPPRGPDTGQDIFGHGRPGNPPADDKDDKKDPPPQENREEDR